MGCQHVPLGTSLSATRLSGALACQLRCIRIVKLGSQGSSAGRSDISTLWESTWTTTVSTIHPRMGTPLKLPLPDSGVPSNIDPRTGAGTQWQLAIAVPTDGSTDNVVFDLPVRASP